ncbi:MAG: site-2 protease family protein [Clostridia bacterium]|nr:site-2 protease family protein [Clostridia bacterium]MDD4047689.1 site-2 protease family protein [Clostridia bacterium]
MFQLPTIDEIIILLPTILLALSIHEFSHGYVAYKLGDPTPEHQGRLTLNPLAHLDPVGTLLLVFAHFGWAKPVMVNPMNFKGDKQRGMLYVALAGPVSNIILALIGAILYNFVYGYEYWDEMVRYFVIINVNLAVFNLIPVPPLDGSKILAGLLPRDMQGIIYKLEMYGPIILILLFVTNLIDIILVPMSSTLLHVIVSISSFIVGFF